MILPVRKIQRLPNFDYSQNAAYFITICTKEHRCILSHIVGCGAFTAPRVELTEYGKIVDRYIRSMKDVDNYVIMPNHVHLIISITDNDGATRASHPTQSISTRIAAMKSLASKKIGHSIWQTSFHDHIIRGEQDYREIWRYIEENPLRWESDRYYRLK